MSTSCEKTMQPLQSINILIVPSVYPDNFTVVGVRLENGNYPTLSLFFVQITIH